MLKVIPNKVNNCILSSVSSPQAMAGELYSINFLCYDKYGNEAHIIDGEFGSLFRYQEDSTFSKFEKIGYTTVIDFKQNCV